jgi:N-acetylmuramoyl-L-alanine amidase
LPAVNTVPILYAPDLSKYTTEAWKNGAQPLLGITVFVDAGHGGSTTKIRDSGAVYAGVLEAPINFKVALLLRTELEARGATVVMTRTEDDQFKSLHYRVALLAHYVFLDHRNAAGADIALLDRLETLFTPSLTLNTDDYSTNGRSVYKGLGARPDLRTILDMQNQHKDIVFVSLHCNSLPTATSVHGLEVYWASRNMIYNDERHLAADKTVKDKYPINPSYQFYDDAARLKFALALKYGILGACPELENLKLANHQVVEGNYAVLREENVVSALIEMGYLTNATDRANLLKPEYRQSIAVGIADGITRFYCG